MTPDHKVLARLADLAYITNTHRVNELEFLLIREECTDYIVISGTEVKSKRKESFVRKLRNISDVVRDMRIMPLLTEINTGKVHAHEGFLTGGRGIIEELKGSLSPERDIICAGHSLGGAVALVVGLLLQETQPVNVKQIVTFGSPKVFLSKIQVPRNTKITMYKNGRDIVTYMPLGRHPVKQTKIGKPSRFWPNITDHRLDTYIKNIQEIT
jgi:predicted lipase